MASYLEKIMREPKNPYLPADGSLAALRAADMAGYRPNEAILPNMNPMLGYTSRRMDGYRPNTLDSSAPKGRQPDKDYSGYGKSLEEALPYGYETASPTRFSFTPTSAAMSRAIIRAMRSTASSAASC